MPPSASQPPWRRSTSTTTGSSGSSSRVQNSSLSSLFSSLSPFSFFLPLTRRSQGAHARAHQSSSSSSSSTPASSSGEPPERAYTYTRLADSPNDDDDDEGEEDERENNMAAGPETDVTVVASNSGTTPEHHGASQVDAAFAKRVLRKIDMRLIPLLFVTYGLNFMDKTILSSAAVFGLRDDTVCFFLLFFSFLRFFLRVGEILTLGHCSKIYGHHHHDPSM